MGPEIFATSSAVSSPLSQPSMSPVTVMTAAPGSAAPAGEPIGVPMNPKRATDVASKDAGAAAQRHDDSPTPTPPPRARRFLLGHLGLRHRVRTFLFVIDRGISEKGMNFGGATQPEKPQ